MAFFAPTFTSTDSLSPFFRLLNDFDGPAFDTSSSPLAAYLTPLPCRRSSTPVRRSLASFQPKFDVRETADAYELHGELAGLDKQDVHIEFTDPQTLVVRGRVERCYTSKPREQMPTEAASEESARDAAEEHAAEAHAEAAHGADHEEAQPATAEAPASPKFHKATVEDTPDKDDAFSVTSMSTTHTAPPAEPEEKAAPVPATAATAAAATVQEKPKTEADAAKYWVQERSVGEFSRTFSFPRLVRQDEVHAALENGILTVVVPKARMETRRVVVF